MMAWESGPPVAFTTEQAFVVVRARYPYTHPVPLGTVWARTYEEAIGCAFDLYGPWIAVYAALEKPKAWAAALRAETLATHAENRNITRESRVKRIWRSLTQWDDTRNGQ